MVYGVGVQGLGFGGSGFSGLQELTTNIVLWEFYRGCVGCRIQGLGFWGFGKLKEKMERNLGHAWVFIGVRYG